MKEKQGNQPIRPYRVTLSEIAREAGVSRQVVSAILGLSPGGNVRFGAQTRERVVEIARQRGFRPNRTAIHLVKKCHGALGILVRHFGSANEHILRCMLYEAHRRGQVFVLDVSSPEDGTLPLVLREDSVDGIVAFEDVEVRIQKEITRLGIPCVRINTNVRNLPGCVAYDEAGAMRLAVRHFVERKRGRLAILAGRSTHYSTRARVRNYMKAAQEHGLAQPRSHTFVADRHTGLGAPEAFAELLEWLSANRDIDALLATVDGMAPLFYRAAARLGLRIPDDIAVIGVNNSQIALGVYPALTSLHVDPKQVGKKAITILNQLIEGSETSSRPTAKIPYHLIVRESTGTL